MGMKLEPRPEVYETFWRFASERQRIFESRVAGEPGPWTDDPILRTYKFCNAFRASDRVSQALIRDVIYGVDGLAEEDTALRIVLFRLFSHERTWGLIDSASETLTAASFNANKLGDLLDREIGSGNRIYTSAFILCANAAFGHARKHRNHLALLEVMKTDRRLWRELANAQSLEAVYLTLRDYPLLGPFMAYQLAIDLNYSEVIDFSENDFTVPGPGALRGIKKVFADCGGASHADVIKWMVEQQEDACDALGVSPPSLFGRPLQAIDVQNLFCEVDKYCRVAFPQLASNRTRIKSTFKASPDALELFYPPKWGLDMGSEGYTMGRELVAAV